MSQALLETLAEQAVALLAETSVAVQKRHPQLTAEEAFTLSERAIEALLPNIVKTLASYRGSDVEVGVLLADVLALPANRSRIAEQIVSTLAQALERSEAA